jgi:hypothetical protein
MPGGTVCIKLWHLLSMSKLCTQPLKYNFDMVYVCHLESYLLLSGYQTSPALHSHIPFKIPSQFLLLQQLAVTDQWIKLTLIIYCTYNQIVFVTFSNTVN